MEEWKINYRLIIYQGHEYSFYSSEWTLHNDFLQNIAFLTHDETTVCLHELSDN